MDLLSKTDLFEQRLPTNRIPIPWLEKEIIVQGMSMRALDAYARLLVSGEDSGISPRTFIFVQCVVNGKGKRVYSDSDITKIADTVDTALIDLVVDEADRLSKVTDERKAAIKKSSKIALHVAPTGG